MKMVPELLAAVQYVKTLSLYSNITLYKNQEKGEQGVICVNFIKEDF